MSSLYDRPTPFIGVGTGRCGSHSLVEIVSACKNTDVRHESVQVPWYNGDGSPGMSILCKWFNIARKNGKLAGEVGPCLVPSIPALRSDFPGLKVVCMHREREEVIRSFCEYGSDMPPLRPVERRRWADGSIGTHHADSNVISCFPLIDGADRQQALSFYWHMYESLMAQISKPVFHLHVRSLNDPKRIVELFDFLQIPECDRVFIEVRKAYSIEEARQKLESSPLRRPRG